MIEKRYGTLGGLKVPCLVYESYDEADKAAGKANATLDEGNDSGYYRGPANDVRDYLCELVEQHTGVERKTKETGKKDDKGNPVLAFAEAEGEYCRRAMATKGQAEFDLTQFQAKLDEWAKTAREVKNGDGQISLLPLAVDFKATERVAKGPGKLAEIYKNSAIACFKNKEKNWPVLESMLANESVAMPTLTGDEGKDIELIGRAIKAAKDSQAKKSLEQFAV